MRNKLMCGREYKPSKDITTHLVPREDFFKNSESSNFSELLFIEYCKRLIS